MAKRHSIGALHTLMLGPLVQLPFGYSGSSNFIVTPGTLEPISFTFTQPIDPASNTPNSVSRGINSLDVPYAGFLNGSWSISGSTFTFTPANPWVKFTDIQTTFPGGITSIDGETAPFTPAVNLYATDPTFSIDYIELDVADLADTAADPIYMKFSARIDETMYPTVTRSNGSNIAGTWARTSRGGTEFKGDTYKFTPSANWPTGETVTVDYSAAKRNIDGSPITNGGSSVFTVL